MSGKRVNKDASSGTLSKKLKHDYDDKLHDPNTLFAMPEHVLDVILNMLDLRDKKTFTQVCKKFKGIFSWPRNLQKIWFNVQRENENLAITRSYTNLSVSYSNGFITIPEKLWITLTPSLTALKLVKSELLTSQEFVSILPHFNSLSYLDIVLSNTVVMERILKKQQTIENPIEMPNLKHLRMNIELFHILNGHLVNFTNADNLQSIHLNQSSQIPLRYGMTAHVDVNIDSNTIRSFISSKLHLTFLILDGNRMLSIFDEPLKMQSQLEEFYLNGNCMYITNCQQDNLCDFLDSQPSLKNMNIGVDPQLGPTKWTTKMTQLRSNILNLPLTKHIINVKFDARVSSRLSNGSKNFSFKELQTALTGSVNIVTTELKIIIIGSAFQFNQTFPSIITKLPNLTSLEIKVYSYKPDPITNASSLNALQHLKHLRLDGSCWKHLKDVIIPALELLELEIESWFEKDLTDFIGCHRRMHQLKLIVYSSQVVTNYTKILEFSLKNLEQLKTFAIKDNAMLSKHEKTKEKSTLELIRNHARLGFVYEHERSYGYNDRTKDLIMKRHDGQLVRYDTKQAKWEKLKIQ